VWEKIREEKEGEKRGEIIGGKIIGGSTYGIKLKQ